MGKDLDLEKYLSGSSGATNSSSNPSSSFAKKLNPHTCYNLVANVIHEGKAEAGRYKVQTLQRDQRYEIQDLRVTAIMPQVVAIAEAYILVYQRQDVEVD